MLQIDSFLIILAYQEAVPNIIIGQSVLMELSQDQKTARKFNLSVKRMSEFSRPSRYFSRFKNQHKLRESYMNLRTHHLTNLECSKSYYILEKIQSEQGRLIHKDKLRLFVQKQLLKIYKKERLYPSRALKMVSLANFICVQDSQLILERTKTSLVLQPLILSNKQPSSSRSLKNLFSQLRKRKKRKDCKKQKMRKEERGKRRNS